MAMMWLRKIHAWIGLGLCLLLALIALTGAAMVFEPYMRGAGPAGPSRATPAELGAAMRAADQAFGADRIKSVVFASFDAERHEVRLADGGGVWLDPADHCTVAFDAGDHVFEFLFDLHHYLLMGDVGIKIAGWAGVVGLVMVLSGLILWWPARRGFQAAVVPKRKGRAGWLGAHRDLGVMVAPLAVLTMVSGIAMALPDIVRPAMNAPAPTPPKDAVVGSGPVNWTAAIAAAHARFPQGTIRMAVAAPKAGQPASVRVRQPQEWHANGRTIVYVDPPTGRVVGVYDALDQTLGARTYNAAWPVHAARVGGLPWKIVVFLGGIALAALSLYGGEAYRRRLFRARK